MLASGNLDEIYAQVNTSGTTTYLRDGLNSTVALTSSTGAITANYYYSPYGDTVQAGTATTPYNFTGREYDTGTSQYYYRARYYSPQLGRFISEDPLGLSGGRNFYAYADGRPTMETDPTGELGALGFLGGVGVNLTLQMISLTYRNGGHPWDAFKCVNWTNVAVAGAFGAVLPGFLPVLRSGYGLVSGTQSVYEFGSNAILFGLVGLPYKAALDLSLPALRIGDDCLCNALSPHPVEHVY